MLGAIQAWPVTRNPLGRLWGDPGDAWQNLWNGWWFGRALAEGRSPFQTDLLWHPDGVNLWLHTLGPLNAAATAALQALLPGFGGFNLVVFAQLVFGAVASWALARALVRRALPQLGRWPTFAAALVGGLVFGFSPYVWGHSAVHLHLQSVGFLALFVLFLDRALHGERWGIWGMALSGLGTALVGWYLLLDEIFIGGIFVLAALWHLRRPGPDRYGPLKRLLAGGALTGLAVAPLLWAVFQAQAEPLAGGHNPRIFALDLYAPFLPSPTMALGGPFLGITRRFSGNAAENATYLGWVALLLTGLAALWLRRRLPWRYLAVGLFGLLVATGPDLRIGGTPHRDLGIFYRALETLLPAIEGLGCPVRFALLANLAVAVGAALGLALLLRWTLAPGRARLALLGPALIALLLLVELWPAPVWTTLFPSPRFLEELAEDPRPGAVIDLTGWTHPLYNQILHGRPIVHGYTSRRPQRLEQKLARDPVLGPLFQEGLHRRAPRRLALKRIEEVIGGDWGAGSPAPAIASDFEATYAGTLLLPEAGRWTFTLGSDDGSHLFLGGRKVLGNGGIHGYLERSVTLELAAGEHPLRITFDDRGGLARLSFLLEGPGHPRAPPAAGLLRAPSGEPGLEASYWHRSARARLSGEAARRHLLEGWGLRFLLVQADRVPAMVEGQLGLREIARESGLVLFEVPSVEGSPEPPHARGEKHEALE